MINVNEKNTAVVIESIHQKVMRKRKKKINDYNEVIVLENRIFSVLVHETGMEPTNCAKELNRRFGYNMNSTDVITAFRRCRIANPIERKELMDWALELAEYYAEAIQGNKEAFDKFEKKRHTPALKNGKKHDSQDRVIVMILYEKYPEIDKYGDIEGVHSFGYGAGRYVLYDLADVITEVYGFEQYREPKKSQINEKVHKEQTMTLTQALSRVEHLENTLERTNNMFQDLQEEFDEQLEESKIKELTDFFAMLNSEKYGCILDELLNVNKGVNQLRKSGYELPLEINGLLIMIKKLIQFVRDNHIDPIMKINSIQEVTAKDIEFCNYEGNPFTSESEKKKVRVVSPGWIYKDKEIQISRPRVKEEE